MLDVGRLFINFNKTFSILSLILIQVGAQPGGHCNMSR